VYKLQRLCFIDNFLLLHIANHNAISFCVNIYDYIEEHDTGMRK